MAKTKKTIPICGECGGLDVRFDAYAGFNPVKQQYEHISEHDNPVCEDCGGECSTEWVPFEGEIKDRWKAWQAGGPARAQMKVWRVSVDIHATMYVKASSEADARAKAVTYNDTGIELDSWSVMTADMLGFSGLQFDDPDLPLVSLSPAMTVIVPDDADVEDADD